MMRWRNNSTHVLRWLLLGVLSLMVTLFSGALLPAVLPFTEETSFAVAYLFFFLCWPFVALLVLYTSGKPRAVMGWLLTTAFLGGLLLF